jgi:hypothetical protein
VDSARLRQLADSLPPRLNAGILMGDGGFCILGWMLFSAGFHPIALYSNTVAVVDLERGVGPAIDVVAREYDLPRDFVVELARVNDATPIEQRSNAVRATIGTLLEANHD